MILILIVDESSAVSRRETAESGDDMQQAPEITDVLEYMDSVVVYQHTVYKVSYQHTGYQWLALHSSQPINWPSFDVPGDVF